VEQSLNPLPVISGDPFKTGGGGPTHLGDWSGMAMELVEILGELAVVGLIALRLVWSTDRRPADSTLANSSNNSAVRAKCGSCV